MGKQLLQISEKLTEKEDIRRLGLNLNLEHETIKTIFTNNPSSITTVANEVLHEWYRRQDNLDDFCQDLGEALIKSNLNMIAATVLDYRRRPFEDGSLKTSAEEMNEGTPKFHQGKVTFYHYCTCV